MKLLLRSSRPRHSSDSCQNAPGESRIHELNPKRGERIREKTGWRHLEPGSLNLVVDDEGERKKIGCLMETKPLVCERPGEVVYPDKWKRIPKERGGYRYYLATARPVKSAGEAAQEQEVLLRQAVKPLCRRLIELFAEVNLRQRFQLQEGDKVEVTFSL